MISTLRSRFGARLAQTGLTLALGIGLTSALWIVTLPVANATLMSPTEMIESGLPPGVMVNTAGKPQFLTAVCAAVKSNPSSAASIAKAAVTAHHEYAGDIVATAIRCASGEEIDCDVTGAIVAAAIVAWPQSAALIDDAALATAPDCADSVQTRTETTRNDGKQVMDGKEMLDGKEVLEDIPAEGPGFGAPNTPPFFGGGGGGFNPGGTSVLICDNGRQRRILGDNVQMFLNNHPGAYVGNCEVTPATAR
ncbi:MAG: hypothetical protein M3Q86_04565 [Verrucomicrobiota bacterium]|nr:hypothetical protein [Verrucomicrobiota bacterium]